MRRNGLLRRNALALPKMTIRARSPWHVQALALLLAVALGVAATALFFTLRATGGASGAAPAFASSDVREQIERLTAERDRLATAANEAESRMNIERAAQKQLATQAKSLELENTRLKEDLVFFDSLLPTATGPAGISIRRLKVDQPAPNQLRYQVLVMQGGKGQTTFSGNLQLALSGTQAGKPAMMIFPEVKTGDPGKYKLAFKHYQRLEGVITIPEGVTVKAVQARVLENGQMRTQQSANL